jgi:hypothetical protein
VQLLTSTVFNYKTLKAGHHCFSNMKFRASHRLPLFPYHTRHGYLHSQRRCFNSFFQKFRTTTQPRASNNGRSGSSQGQSLLLLRAYVVYLEFQKPKCTCLFVWLLRKSKENNWNRNFVVLHSLLLIFYGSASYSKATLFSFLLRKWWYILLSDAVQCIIYVKMTRDA